MSLNIASYFGCFVDAVEFLLKVFYVLDLSYPHEVKPLYGLLDKLMGLQVLVVRCAALIDFMHKISGY